MLRRPHEKLFVVIPNRALCQELRDRLDAVCQSVSGQPMDRVALLGYEDKEQYDMFDDHVRNVVDQMCAWQEDVLQSLDDCIDQIVSTVRADMSHSSAWPSDTHMRRQRAVLRLLEWRQHCLDFEYVQWQERKRSVIENMRLGLAVAQWLQFSRR